MSNILLINGFWVPTSTISELLSFSQFDSNIFLTFPIGIMTIAGWCRKLIPSYGLKVIDYMLELHKFFSNKENSSTEIKIFINKVLDSISDVPDYIGISMGSSCGHLANLMVVSECKKRWPHCKVIAGGTHATACSDIILSDSEVDCVIRGPGDVSFVDLIRFFAGEKGVIPEGASFKSLPSKHISESIRDLSMLPPYPYDLIDFKYLVDHDETAPIKRFGAKTGVIMTSRGCPFNCTYCAASQIHGKNVLFRPIKSLIDEIRNLVIEYGVNTVCIIDDLFGANRRLFFSFFEELDKSGLDVRVVIPAGLSIKIYDEEMIDILVAHGLDSVYFPVESGCQYVQDKLMKKNINLKKARRLIEYTKSKNIFTGVNIILGMPGETKNMIMETFNFLLGLPVDWIAFFIACPYPGTEMTNTLISSGAIKIEDLMLILNSSTQSSKTRLFDTKDISGKELSEIIDSFNIELNFLNNYNLRNKRFDIMLKKLDKIIERYPIHVIARICRAVCYQHMGEISLYKSEIEQINKILISNDSSRKLFVKYENKIRELISDFSKEEIEKLYVFRQ